MYRDAYGGGAPFDPDADFGVFLGNDSIGWAFVRNVSNQSPSGVEIVNNVAANPCLVYPPDISVEKGVYRFTLTLPLSNLSYMIGYQRCCRNVTINNIVRPDETGAAFNVIISPTAQITCNNSPKFDNFPPIVICLGEPVNFDHSATDEEGDQLVYEFCAPLQAGGQAGTTNVGGDPRSCEGVRPDPDRCPPPFREVSFLLPTYSAVNPLGGDPQVVINNESGFISGVPTVEGQFVVGVCVKEFRNGELIGTLRRDFQFNVAQCEQTVVADIQADAVLNGQNFLINSCGENTLTFDNNSFEIANIRSYDWEFLSGDVVLTSDERDATITFPGQGQYDGTMVINKGTECADTAYISVNIFPSIVADFEFTYDTCIAGPVVFEDLSKSDAGPILDWEWDFGDGNMGLNNRNTSNQYTAPGDFQASLTVTDANQCTDQMVKTVSWKPVPSLIVIEPTTFIGCRPANIFFNNLSNPIDSTYDIAWDFGDGNTSDEISPTHIYSETGIYDVRIDITSPFGCTTFRNYSDWIKVEPSPTADFNFSPEEPTIFNKDIDFTDQSIGAVGWLWVFGDVGISLDRNPTFTFPDTGVYKVDLIVANNVACTDTFTEYLDISPFITYHLPNAFTPNNDAQNDEFVGVGISDNIAQFKMNIYNRWGQRVFSSENPNLGWNGRKGNNGEDAPSGIYVYTVEYLNPRGEQTVKKGHVTLVR
jgi:gliding motility-associated-like protein